MFSILEKENGSVVKEHAAGIDSLMDARRQFADLRYSVVGKEIAAAGSVLELVDKNQVVKLLYPEPVKDKKKAIKRTKKKEAEENEIDEEKPKKKKKKEEKGPKRMSGYMYFGSVKRQAVKEVLMKEQPELSAKDLNQAIMKQVAVEWKKLTESEQNEYKEKAPLHKSKEDTLASKTKKNRDIIIDKVGLEAKMKADGFETIEIENDSGTIIKQYQCTHKKYSSLIDVARALYHDHVKFGIEENTADKDQKMEDPIDETEKNKSMDETDEDNQAPAEAKNE